MEEKNRMIAGGRNAHTDDLDARRSMLRQPAVKKLPSAATPNVARTKSSQFRHRPNGRLLPELRKALFRPTFQSARLLALLFCLVSLASTSFAPAHDEAQVEEEEMVIDAGFEMAESNFDQWIFGTQTSGDGLKRIESLLTLKVEAIDRICGLTEDQTAKLQLSGQGDIKRFYDDVDVARAKFMKVRRNRNAFNNVWQEIQPLQTRVNAGLFDQASFFQKVLNRSLNDEQSAQYEEAERQRRQFRYNAKAGLAVAMIERTMPLRAEQRQRLIQVIKEETKPPKSFGQYDFYVVLYQLAKVPDQKLKPIFDEPQWKVLKPYVAQGLAMEPWLKQQKVLP